MTMPILYSLTMTTPLNAAVILLGWSHRLCCEEDYGDANETQQQLFEEDHADVCRVLAGGN